MAGSPVKLTKDGETREVTSPAEQVRLEFDGWKVQTSTKKASTDNK